jgi:GntR family transcriptional repressor for pyruvate dehydrogenase complex
MSQIFRTVGKSGRLVDRVVGEIERLVVEGVLKPGMKLPPERELGEQLEVSRTVIREAVQILSAKGLVDARPGAGTMVRQLTADQITEPLSLLLHTRAGGISFEQLHQVRSILELEIAGLAAREATDADIAQLKQHLRALEQAQHNAELFTAKDAGFHQALAEMTHNPLLVLLAESVRHLPHSYLIDMTPYQDLPIQMLPSYKDIVERVAARDVEGARAAMQVHLACVRKQTKDEPFASAQGR